MFILTQIINARRIEKVVRLVLSGIQILRCVWRNSVANKACRDLDTRIPFILLKHCKR